MNVNFGGIKQNYSFLFSNNNKNSNTNDNLFNSINLSDYNSIKSGSYGKLLKEYYKKGDIEIPVNSDKSSVNKIEDTEKKALKEIEKESKELKNSSNKLMQKGKDSVFSEEAEKDTKYEEKLYTAVNNFVEDFNSVVEKSKESGNKVIKRTAEGLTTLAKDYEKELKEIGITFDKNNKLTIDKDTFSKADTDKVKDTFNGDKSFSYLTSVRAMTISSEANREGSKLNFYNNTGNQYSYNNNNFLNMII